MHFESFLESLQTADLEVDFSEGDLEAFCEEVECFYHLLSDINTQINLTRIQSGKEFLIKHIYDSLMLLHFPISGKVVDWGCGGGFPGIPLALFGLHFSLDYEITMVESVGKKARAVESMIEELKLENCRVVNERGEIFLNKNSNIDHITMRAVAPPEKAIKWLSRACGQWLFYTGPDVDQVWLSMSKQLKQKGFSVGRVVPYTLPADLGRRNIVEITRIS